MSCGDLLEVYRRGHRVSTDRVRFHELRTQHLQYHHKGKPEQNKLQWLDVLQNNLSCTVSRDVTFRDCNMATAISLPMQQ